MCTIATKGLHYFHERMVRSPITNFGTTSSSIVITTEYLQWCIVWTLAFPVTSTNLLLLNLPSNDDDKSYVEKHGNCMNENEYDTVYDDKLWLSYIAFHTIINKNYHPDVCCTRPALESLIQYSSVEVQKVQLEVPPISTNCTNEWKRSLGYGEITEMAVFQIIHSIIQIQQRKYNEETSIIRTMIDLGSGSGRVVLASALALLQQHHRSESFSPMTTTAPVTSVTAIGLEIVPALHQMAIHNILQYWTYEQQQFFQKYKTNNNNTIIHYQCCDFTQPEIVHWYMNLVDLIIIHGTVFEDLLWEKIFHLIVQYSRHNTWIVSVSRRFQSPCSCNDRIQLQFITELNVDMNWGRGIVYIYRTK